LQALSSYIDKLTSKPPEEGGPSGSDGNAGSNVVEEESTEVIVSADTDPA
jgi:hypothetical protein